MQYLLLAAIIILVIGFSGKKNKPVQYKSKLLLTKHEFWFYNSLKKVTESFGLQILAKIRLADLVDPMPNADRKEWYRDFAKVQSKHIDFAVCDNMKVILLIELDDKSHERTERQERDNFVNEVLSSAGYTLIRTYGETDAIKQALEEKMRSKIN